MCLSTVFAVSQGSENKVCEYVCSVKVNGDVVKLNDVMGVETEVKGKLVSCDFVSNKIVIEEA